MWKMGELFCFPETKGKATAFSTLIDYWFIKLCHFSWTLCNVE